jgi:hypothetical protein
MVANLARGFMPAPEPAAANDEPGESTVIILPGEETAEGTADPASGALKIEVEDGSVKIDLSPQSPAAKKINPEDHDANLADFIDPGELGRIASQLSDAIQQDDQSRDEWLQTRAAGIELLGFKLEEPRGDTGTASAPVEGMSTVRHPLLTEAVIRFQSNASAELLPAGGPVKVRDDSPIKPAPPPGAPPGIGHNGGPELTDGPDPAAASADPNAQTDEDGDDLAEALEKDFNHYLTATDKGYRPDTDRMLFWVGFGGAGFKKVYNCPIRRMPISRSVDASDLIVSNAANDFEDSGRVTHRILMRRSTLVRMQIAGVYRNLGSLTAGQPTYQPNAVDTTIAMVQGFNDRMQRPEDAQFTIYECYTELNIKGLEHVDSDGKPTGLELPYRVTLDKDSRQILEIRRNWKKDDINCLPKRVFVKFPFIPAMGFYDIGLLHLLGNADKALTAAWRMMLDTGMFASFPGFLYADSVGRQQTNVFRVGPGMGAKIQTGSQPIQNVVMPLPYKDVGQGLAMLVKDVETTGQRVGGTAELQVGEGRQDAPVGTTLALIEQAGKMLSAVHVRLHAAQSEEFQLLKERFREDPEAFWRHNPKCAKPWKQAQFIAALEKCDIVPAADPNTSSHMQRIMKAVAIKQLQAMNPGLYDGKAVDSMILKMIGIGNYQKLFAPPPPPGAPAPGAPPPDPAKMAALQLKASTEANKQQANAAQSAQDAIEAKAAQDARAREVAVESADRAADRESRERVAGMREETEQIKANADLAKTHAGIASDLQQHSDSLAAEQARHAAGLVSDHIQQRNELSADADRHAAEMGAKTGGVIREHLRGVAEHRQADEHHRDVIAQEDRHHADEMAAAEAEREAAAKAARDKGGLAKPPSGHPRVI